MAVFLNLERGKVKLKNKDSVRQHGAQGMTEKLDLLPGSSE